MNETRQYRPTSRNYLLAAVTFTANTNLWPSRLLLFRFPFNGPGNLKSTFGAAAWNACAVDTSADTTTRSLVSSSRPR